MPRDISITRDEAENLVDLLEDSDPKVTGSWRYGLADEIRQRFGMVPRTPNLNPASIMGISAQVAVKALDDVREKRKIAQTEYWNGFGAGVIATIGIVFIIACLVCKH